MSNLYNNVLNLISESESILINEGVRNLVNRTYNSVVKPLAKYSGKKVLELGKHEINFDKLSRSQHKLNKINSELYAAKLAKDKSKTDLLTKKLNYHNEIHKNLQQNKINKNQHYIQKTKEMEFRIKELTQSNKEPEALKKLQEKYNKRKLYLNKLGVNTDE